MRILLLLIAVLMILLGLAGVLWPEGLIELVKYSFTSRGIYVGGFARAILGGLIAGAAGATRTPKTVRIIGIIVFAAGVATIVGAQSAPQMREWWIDKGHDALRIAACIPLLIGCFLGGTTLTKDRRS